MTRLNNLVDFNDLIPLAFMFPAMANIVSAATNNVMQITKGLIGVKMVNRLSKAISAYSFIGVNEYVKTFFILLVFRLYVIPNQMQQHQLIQQHMLQ